MNITVTSELVNKIAQARHDAPDIYMKKVDEHAFEVGQRGRDGEQPTIFRTFQTYYSATQFWDYKKLERDIKIFLEIIQLEFPSLTLLPLLHPGRNVDGHGNIIDIDPKAWDDITSKVTEKLGNHLASELPPIQGRITGKGVTITGGQRRC